LAHHLFSGLSDRLFLLYYYYNRGIAIQIDPLPKSETSFGWEEREPLKGGGAKRALARYLKGGGWEKI
jgi:hypothetical protein